MLTSIIEYSILEITLEIIGISMKTSQVMVREFAGEYIRQNHLTKMFSANDLAKLFPNKNLYDWINKQDTEIYIKKVMERENIDLDQVIKHTKVKRGEGSGTWLHPMLAIDLAMWLSVDFKYDVIRWVFDNLCVFRDQAGDNHREMGAAIKDVLNPTDGYVYADETHMVQELACVKNGSRNECKEEQLKLLNDIQKWNTKLLRMGITNRITRRSRIIEFIEMNS